MLTTLIIFFFFFISVTFGSQENSEGGDEGEDDEDESIPHKMLEEEMEVETASAASLRTRNDRQLRGAERSHGLGDLVGCRGRQHINLPSARASWAAAKEPRHVIRASDIAVSRGDCFQKVLGFGLEL